MKVLYIDCSMGAAGDMLLSALTELMDEPERFMEKLNGLGIPKTEYKKSSAVKCGIVGTHIEVLANGEIEGEHHHEHSHHHEHGHHHEHKHHHEHHHHHHHSTLHDVEHVIKSLDVSQEVKDNALKAFWLIAQAESRAHGKPIDEIHFHEVGTLDAVADVVGVCLAMEEIGAEKIVASAVHVGSGSVKCAHGVLPVPAPATAHILTDVPIYGGKIEGELCTPTGAALLKTFVSSFGDMPEMTVTKIGYGMGTKDFEAANCVRVMLGERKSASDRVIELVCNIDDMTAEDMAFALEMLSERGAKDVYTAPIYMKKNRLGTLLSVICAEEDREKMLETIFKHTSTIGVREYMCNRYVLEREEKTVDTPHGSIRVKRSHGYGVSREKAEYEDLAKAAREEGISIREVKKDIYS